MGLGIQSVCLGLLYLSNYRQVTSHLNTLGLLSWLLMEVPFQSPSRIERGPDECVQEQAVGTGGCRVQEGTESLGHLCMWKEQGQSSPGAPQAFVLFIYWLVSGASSETSLSSSCLSCLRSQALAETVHAGH